MSRETFEGRLLKGIDASLKKAKVKDRTLRLKKQTFQVCDLIVPSLNMAVECKSTKGERIYDSNMGEIQFERFSKYLKETEYDGFIFIEFISGRVSSKAYCVPMSKFMASRKHEYTIGNVPSYFTPLEKVDGLYHLPVDLISKQAESATKALSKRISALKR